MPDSKTSVLPAAGALIGTERFPLSDGTTESKYGTPDQLKTYLSSLTLNPSFFGLPVPTDWSVAPIKSINIAAGDVDIYTVPAGNKLLVVGVMVANPTAAAVVVIPKVKIGASYYRIGQNLSVPTVGSAATNSSYLLNAGETIAFNAAAAGVSVHVRAFLMPDTSPLKIARVNSLAAGNNTIYTVPTGKTAVIIPITPLPYVNGSGMYTNDTGVAQTVKYYLVPSGGTAGTTNQVGQSVSVANAGAPTSSIGMSASAGDSIVVNAAAATAVQTFYFLYYEI